MRIRSSALRSAAVALALALVAVSLVSASQASGRERSNATDAARLRGQLPTLLTGGPSYDFVVRPRALYPTGDGSGVVGKFTDGRGRSIHWRVWNAHDAWGWGTVWLNDGIPTVAEGTFHHYAGKLHAFKVRHGHFTELIIRYRMDAERAIWALIIGSLGNGNGYVWYSGA